MTLDSYSKYQQVSSRDDTSKDTYEYEEAGSLYDFSKKYKCPTSKWMMIGSLIFAMICGSSLLLSSLKTDFNRVVCAPDESPLIGIYIIDFILHTLQMNFILISFRSISPTLGRKHIK